MSRRRDLWQTNDERKLIDKWAATGYSRRTMSQYLSAVRYAQRWCKDRGLRLRTLPATMVMELPETLPFTWSSRRRLRSALGAYWEAFGRRNPPVRAIRCPSKPRMRSRALEELTAAELEAAARARADRKGLAVLIGLYLALRRAEIAALRWTDFDEKLEWVTFVGKGDVTATLPVHPVVIAALEAIPRNDSPWVFPGRFAGRHCSPATIWDWVRKVARDAQLNAVAPHVLRHTCLTTANDATGDLRAVQLFARHARPDTTAGYTRVSKKRVVHVMLSLDYEAAAKEAS